MTGRIDEAALTQCVDGGQNAFGMFVYACMRSTTSLANKACVRRPLPAAVFGKGEDF